MLPLSVKMTQELKIETEYARKLGNSVKRNQAYHWTKPIYHQIPARYTWAIAGIPQPCALEITLATDLLRRKTPEAVEEAIRLLHHPVYSFSGHPEDAEDTMQEVP
jgi:hypothetical protein